MEQITLLDPDPDTGEVEVIVQGFTSNTCTAVDGASITQQEDVFSVKVETSNHGWRLIASRNSVQFEETVMLDTQDLEPGSYLVTSGTVQTFEVAAAQPAEEPEAPAGSAEGRSNRGMTPRQRVSLRETDAQGAGSTTTTQPTSDEPRDCQDTAGFCCRCHLSG